MILAAAFLGLGLGTLACEQPLPLPDGVRALRIKNPTQHWERSGFTEVVPSILPPIPKGKGGKIEVFVKIPPGKKISAVPGPDGPVFRWPVGTSADRVESLQHKTSKAWAVGDVRGATILADDDEEHHLYRPAKAGFGGKPLLGYAWLRSQPTAELAAHEHLGQMMERGFGQLHAVKGKRLEKRIRLTKERGACRSCHTRLQPAAKRLRMVQRRTDASGWYAPLASMLSSAPMERYRARMVAAENPHVQLRCADGAQPTRDEEKDGRLRVNCPQKAPVIATLNVKAGLLAGDAHTEAVCKSRTFLWRHFDAAARAAFKNSYQECATCKSCGYETPTSPGEEK